MSVVERPRPTEPVPGAVIFARYAYAPNALGYCGPGDPEALLHAATDAGGTDTLRHLAREFEGAWPYLELIAACNRIADPLDRRVVEAYWIGNALLEHVPAPLLCASMAERFEHRGGRDLGSIVEAADPGGGLAQHSFHVFAVYPWLGLLRAGMASAPLTVLDRCRIRSGVVEAVVGDLAVVRSRRLVFDGRNLGLGEETSETVRRGVDGVGFAGPVTPGDLVSLHWDWICDHLTEAEQRRLEHCTRVNLDAVNGLAAPGPAVAIDRYGG